jgi:hypothetical protein
MNFTVYSVEDTILDSCWYSLNHGANTSVDCKQNITGITSEEGANKWYVFSNNTNGTLGNSYVNFFVDTQPPNATLLAPGNGTTSLNGSFNFTVNLSDNYDLENATLLIYNDSDDLIHQETVEVSGTEAVIGVVYEFLSSGVYRWFYQVVDVAGNIFSTINWTLDATVIGEVTIDLIDPSTNTNVNPGEYFTFSAQINCIDGDCGDVNATLDPAPPNWWNSTFKFRQNINITSVASFSNFPAYINVSYDASMQSDYDDLRFINGSCSSNETLVLDHEIENYTSTNAHVWVKLPSLVSS